MSISAFTTNCLVEYLNGFKISLFVTGNHHLGNALTVFHHKVLLREID